MKKIYIILHIIMALPLALEAATVVWQGINPISVTDTNVILKKKVTLAPGVTTIRAVTQDVTVRLEDDPVVTNTPFNNSILELDAAAGLTITVKVKKERLKLLSKGGELILRWTGNGTVRVVEEK